MTHFHELFTAQLGTSSGGSGGEAGEVVVTTV